MILAVKYETPTASTVGVQIGGKRDAAATLKPKPLVVKP